MKILGITSAAILFSLLGSPAPAYARQEQHGEGQNQHEQQQGKHEEGKPSPQRAQQQRQSPQKRQQHAQQQHPQQGQHAQQQQAQQQRQSQDNQEHAAQQLRRHTQQQRAQTQRPQRAQQQHGVQQSAWQQHRSQNWQSDHRTWQQRGGYHGYRIPDDRYRGYFGPDHGFRIQGLPFQVVGGYPRFQYQGYWISTVDPWPDSWGNDWYDTDDVYVNYVDNGYYLYNRRHPSSGIAINITL